MSKARSALLGAATLALGATSLVLWQSLERERALVRQLQSELSAARETPSTSGRPAQAAVAPESDQSTLPSDGAITKTAANTPSSKDAAASALQADEVARAMRISRDTRRRMLEDGQTRTLMQAARLARLQRENGDVQRALSLGDEQRDALIKLLADQEQKRSDGVPTRNDQVEREEIVALLGEDGARKFDTYRAQSTTRGMVQWYRAQLGEQDVLTDDQSARLTSELYDEQQLFTRERDAKLNVVPGMPYRSISAGYVGMVASTAADSETIYRQMNEQLETYTARMHARAATILTPSQLARFDALQAEGLANNRITLREYQARDTTTAALPQKH
jgi:hypothetical protein